MRDTSDPQTTALATVTIREATEADLMPILEIYNDEVVSSTANFDLEPRSPEEHEQWFREHAYPHVVIVAVEGERVIGWASLSQFRSRAGYRFTAEDSVYVHKEYRRRGVGRLLLLRLIEIARERGFHVLAAVVDGSNEASIKLHEGVGFQQAGVLKEVGHKFGRWLDVIEMQRIL